MFSFSSSDFCLLCRTNCLGSSFCWKVRIYLIFWRVQIHLIVAQKYIALAWLLVDIFSIFFPLRDIAGKLLWWSKFTSFLARSFQKYDVSCAALWTLFITAQDFCCKDDCEWGCYVSGGWSGLNCAIFQVCMVGVHGSLGFSSPPLEVLRKWSSFRPLLKLLFGEYVSG